MSEIILRPATVEDADALAAIMIEANVHAFRGIVPDQCLQWITHEESATNWRKTISNPPQGNCLSVAESAGEIVGFALGILRPDDPVYRTDLRVMMVKPLHQRRGIGRQLVRRVVEHFRSINQRSMLVRVLMLNPNRAFYEKLGATFLNDEPYDWNGVPLRMAVYGWTDTSAI